MSLLNCEEVDTDALITITYDLVDLSKKLFIDGGINNKYSTIEQLANARSLVRKSKEVVAEYKEITTKALICKIVSTYDLEPYIDQAEKELKDYLGVFDELDLALENDFSLDEIIESDNPNETINAKVSAIFKAFENKFKSELEELKKVIREAFYILEYLGSTREEIDLALEEIEYQDNLKSYLTDLFINLAEKAVNRVST